MADYKSDWEAKMTKYHPKGWRVYVAGFVLILGLMVTIEINQFIKNDWLSIIVGIIIMTSSWLLYVALLKEEVNKWIENEAKLNILLKTK